MEKSYAFSVPLFASTVRAQQIVGFSVRPAKTAEDDKYNITSTHVPENEAEVFAVYADLPDGTQEWLADFADRSTAEMFVQLVTLIIPKVQTETKEPTYSELLAATELSHTILCAELIDGELYGDEQQKSSHADHLFNIIQRSKKLTS